MLNIFGVYDRNQESQAYYMQFDGNNILFATHFSYSTIKYFLPHNHNIDLQMQTKSHPVYQILNNEMYLKSEIKFDLSYLNALDLKSVDYILVTDYLDLLTLPYIIRIKQFHGKILLTYPMYQLGKIFVQSFMNKIQQRNRYIYDLNKPTFFQQSQAYQLFQEKYGHKVEDWTSLYNKQNFHQMLNSCQKLNYGQQYKKRGLKIIPYSSGYSMGSAMWLIQSEMSNESVLFMMNSSNCQWRHSCAIQKNKIQKKVKKIIVSKGCIKDSNKIEADVQLKKFFQIIQSQLRKSKNCYIKVNDVLQIMDILDVLNWKFKGIFKQLFIEDQIFDKFVKYGNSFVEYLSIQLKNKIYLDTPEYPFSSYDFMSEKLFLSCGKLQKVAHNQKIPLKQLILRYNPAIYFISNHDQILKQSNHNFLFDQILDPRMVQSQFIQWTNQIKYQCIYTFGQLPYAQTIPFKFKYQIKCNNHQYLSFTDFEGFPLMKVKLQNKNLKQLKCQQTFYLISKNWKILMKNKLQYLNMMTEILDQQTIKTANTYIRLTNYTFYIQSSKLSESNLIYQLLKQLTKTIKLK